MYISGFDKQSLAISDMEMAIKSVSEINSNNYRLRRIIETNDFLKDSIHIYVAIIMFSF